VLVLMNAYRGKSTVFIMDQANTFMEGYQS
jgi:hypothetical protein